MYRVEDDMKTTTEMSKQWPWVPAAFALAGVIVFIFATYGPPASSSGFVSTLKGILNYAAPEYVKTKFHYQIIPDPGSWVFTFVLGMAIGGFIAARVSGTKINHVPEIWEKRFGRGRVKRYIISFLGGFLILFASRLAGGCTLGLFISGSAQIAVSGFYFGIVIFAAAMITARLLYGKRGKEKG